MGEGWLRPLAFSPNHEGRADPPLQPSPALGRPIASPSPACGRRCREAPDEGRAQRAALDLSSSADCRSTSIAFRSEEPTSELQSLMRKLVFRLLHEKSTVTPNYR